MQQPSLMRRAGAEFIGAYGIVTAGCGAIMGALLYQYLRVPVTTPAPMMAPR